MKIIKQLVAFSAISALFLSCESDDSDPVPFDDAAAFETGIILSNEGPFNMGNGSITFINPDTGIAIIDIFATTNPGEELGNIVQSIGFTDTDAYIIANNSNKITVADRTSFESIATIESGLENPRYMNTFNDKGFVSNWGDAFVETDDYIAVVDLISNEVITTIPVVLGPERMVADGNTLYVAHKGAFGFNNVITVIDMDNNVVIETLTVGDVPDSMQIIGGDLWVLCAGKPEFSGEETAGSLIQFDLGTNTVSNTFDFELTSHPSDLVNMGANLYFTLNGAIRVLSTQSPVLPGTAFATGSFYEIEVNNGKLYATDAVDFNSNGTLTIYDIFDGTQEASFEVGIIPGGIYFNE